VLKKMIVLDGMTGTVVARIMTNHSMTIDQCLALVGCTVEDDGQIRRDDELLEAFYDNLTTQAQLDADTVKN